MNDWQLRDIAEWVVLGLVLVILALAVLWVAGWILIVLGKVFLALSKFLFSLLTFLVPALAIAGLIYLAVYLATTKAQERKSS